MTQGSLKSGMLDVTNSRALLSVPPTKVPTNVLMYGEGTLKMGWALCRICLSVWPRTIVPQFRRPRRNSRHSKALHVFSNRQKI